MVSTRRLRLIDDASARRRTWPLSRVAPVPGDRVTWDDGRHAGKLVAISPRDGMAELLCDADGRRWRLPLADLRRART